jgi:hypothetical protein
VGPDWTSITNRFGGEPDQLSLLPPAKGVRALKIIRGSIPVYLEKEKKRTVVFDDIKKAQGKQFELDGITYQFDFFYQSPTRERYELLLTATGQKQGRPSGEAEEDGAFELLDSKGNAYEWLGRGLRIDGTTTEIQFSYGLESNNAGQLGPPAKLVYVETVRQIVHVPFVFKDLPLP